MLNCKNDNCEVRAKRYRSLYIDRFMSLKAAPDMLLNNLFPNAKEITESFSAYQAAVRCLSRDIFHQSFENVMVSVGDGHRPATAGLFAFLTRWECHSIDPVLRERKNNIQRLVLHSKQVEQTKLEFNVPTLICGVHSHARLSDCLQSIKAPYRSVIAMPCCVPLNLDRSPDYEYVDDNVWSPCNLIKVWNDV